MTINVHQMAEARQRRAEFEAQRQRAATALMAASVEFRKLQDLDEQRQRR